MDFRAEYKGVTQDDLTLSTVSQNTNDPTHVTNGLSDRPERPLVLGCALLLKRNASLEMLMSQRRQCLDFGSEFHPKSRMPSGLYSPSPHAHDPLQSRLGGGRSCCL